MSTITLSGWGQPHDALHDVAPGATHVEYTHTGSVEAALDTLGGYAHAHTVIGWSMGGQLAVRAVAEGVLKPKKLVLIATPLRFMQNTGPQTLQKFRDNFIRNPARALDKGYALIAHEDTRGGYVRERLQDMRRRVPAHDWLYWFDAISMHGFDEVDFSAFPPTELIHGDRDVVVDIAQSHAFAQVLPRASLHVIEGCGHAPHWHDAPRVRSIITGAK